MAKTNLITSASYLDTNSRVKCSMHSSPNIVTAHRIYPYTFMFTLTKGCSHTASNFHTIVIYRSHFFPFAAHQNGASRWPREGRPLEKSQFLFLQRGLEDAIIHLWVTRAFDICESALRERSAFPLSASVGRAAGRNFLVKMVGSWQLVSQVNLLHLSSTKLVSLDPSSASSSPKSSNSLFSRTF